MVFITGANIEIDHAACRSFRPKTNKSHLNKTLEKSLCAHKYSHIMSMEWHFDSEIFMVSW